MVRNLASSGGRHQHPQAPPHKRYQAPPPPRSAPPPPRSAPPPPRSAPPPPRSAPPPQQRFKVPKLATPANNSHPGVRRDSIINKQSLSHRHSEPSTNNNIINEVKPKIQSTAAAPSPTAMLSRSISGRFQPRASSPSSQLTESSPCSDGMVSRGTFLPGPGASMMYGYPSGCPGSRMT